MLALVACRRRSAISRWLADFFDIARAKHQRRVAVGQRQREIGRLAAGKATARDKDPDALDVPLLDRDVQRRVSLLILGV